MSNNLQSIMIDLKNASDEQENVTDVNLVIKAIDRLEVFPMSMVQLQETRIGQILQAIRHKVDPQLQRRIRAIIKAWQKLLQPDQACATIIPQQIEKRPFNSAATLSERSIYSTSPSTNNSDRLLRHQMSVNLNQVTEDINRTAIAAPTVHHDDGRYSNPERASRRLTPTKQTVVEKVISVKKPLTGLVPSGFGRSTSNGSHSVAASPKLNGQVHGSTGANKHMLVTRVNSADSYSVNSDSSNHERRLSTSTHRIAKVKSTAELIQAAGGCIDPTTVDRILSNRIVKESDERPRVVPLVPTRVSRQSKCLPHPASSGNVKASLSRLPTSEVLSGNTPASDTHISMAKSEIMAKFLESTVLHQEQMKTEAPTFSRVDASRQITAPDRTDFDNTGEHSELRKHHHREKKKHKHKLKQADNGEHHHRKKVAVPPITNRMNEWPELPSLPTDINKLFTEEDIATVFPLSPRSQSFDCPDRLLRGNWHGVNCVLDGQQKPQPMTTLFSVDLDEDNLVHVLPWVNLTEYQQSFFPSESDEVERLSNIPDPW